MRRILLAFLVFPLSVLAQTTTTLIPNPISESRTAVTFGSQFIESIHIKAHPTQPWVATVTATAYDGESKELGKKYIFTIHDVVGVAARDADTAAAMTHIRKAVGKLAVKMKAQGKREANPGNIEAILSAE